MIEVGRVSGRADNFEDPPRRRRTFRRLLATAALLCIASILYFTFNLGLIYRYSSSRASTRTGAILVMGTAEFNGVPSPAFLARLKTAVDLYRRGIAPLVLVLGGSRPGDHFTEAGVGATYLRQQGLPASSVIAVPRGVDTYISVVGAIPILRSKGISTVTVVSDGFHLYRSTKIVDAFHIRALGYADVGSPIVGALKYEYFLREAVAVSVAGFIGYGEESELRHG